MGGRSQGETREIGIRQPHLEVVSWRGAKSKDPEPASSAGQLLDHLQEQHHSRHDDDCINENLIVLNQYFILLTWQ